MPQARQKLGGEPVVLRVLSQMARRLGAPDRVGLAQQPVCQRRRCGPGRSPSASSRSASTGAVSHLVLGHVEEPGEIARSSGPWPESARAAPVHQRTAAWARKRRESHLCGDAGSRARAADRLAHPDRVAAVAKNPSARQRRLLRADRHRAHRRPRGRSARQVEVGARLRQPAGSSTAASTRPSPRRSLLRDLAGGPRQGMVGDGPVEPDHVPAPDRRRSCKRPRRRAPPGANDLGLGCRGHRRRGAHLRPRADDDRGEGAAGSSSIRHVPEHQNPP